MDSDSTETKKWDIPELKQEWERFFEKYFEYMFEHKKNPKDLRIERIFKYYEANINYIEKYMEILKTTNDKEQLEKLIRINDLHKSWNDLIYNPNESTNSNMISNSKIEIVN